MYKNKETTTKRKNNGKIMKNFRIMNERFFELNIKKSSSRDNNF